MSRIAVVTGANQGLGLAVVRGLARVLGPEDSVYLTARDPDRGRGAVRLLEAEGLRPLFHRLDVREDLGVAAFAETVRRRHGQVDIVVSTRRPGSTPMFRRPSR